MPDLPIRDDLAEAERHFWEHVAMPGTWWTGAERVAAVGAARRATTCALCSDRKTALSPGALTGRHDDDSQLPDTAVEVVHQVRTDPGRLSREWFERCCRAGISGERYVEMVAIVTMATGLDVFSRALGRPLHPLPEPQPGAPTRHRPKGLRANGAWLPTLEPADVTGTEADLYPPNAVVPNIAKALSLVPDEVRMLRTLSAALYMPIEHVSDPTFRRGPLDRMQMELVAGRVSALNECFY